MANIYTENIVGILEGTDELRDMSNMLVLANNGIDDTLVNSLVTVTIDNLDRISEKIRKEIEELRDLLQVSERQGRLDTE